VKHRRAIFHAWVGLTQIPQKRISTRYAKVVFLHPVGSKDHIVQSGVFGE
jgi:hypothetical protein